MAEQDKTVIDASIALSFLLPDEKYHPKAKKALLQHLQRGTTLIAPSLLLYEIVNGLKSAILRKRVLSLEKSRKLLRKFLKLDLKFYDYLPFCQTSLDLAVKYNLSVYDAAYVSLAQKENCRLLTADKKLFNKLKKDIPWIKFLGDINVEKDYN